MYGYGNYNNRYVNSYYYGYGNGNAYSRQRYGGRGYSSYNGVYRQNNLGQQKKRSGAKIQFKDGAPIVSAWKKNRMGFYVLYARPYKNTKVTTSQNGKEWANLFVTITNQTTMETRSYSGMFDMSRKRLYIKELNMIVTTGGSGGYWGKHLGGR